ncbi:hypothetical protein QR680_014875 [Steinernema hermaphroditum]|uniref:Uncharacterized protein n=1 Tax=Steinernema hermaphroditum TaxID=289476 RepID=A0AA39M506_9BILA|nr:hypothetical protein QR680_014875 [Steinernema hermaphroditum]
MEFRDINPYEYLSLNGYLISVPIHVKHAFILSSLLYINLTGTLGLHDDLVGVMATFGGLCYYPLMIVALNRQPYKQILAGIFTIFQGILTAMLVIAGFIGLLRVFLYTCQADLGEICQLSAFDDFLRILGAWMFATLFAALTYFHYLYYEYLGFEEQRNRPEVGNVTPQENPFATIPFSNGYFPVAKASKWMCLACFNIFFNSYLLKYILFPSRKWWLFKIPLVFGLFHFVIYKIRTMKRVEKYRIAIIANFVYFLVVYSMAMALYGFINFIIALTYHSSARGLIALGCFVSVVFFAFCAFFFYYYGMFLDFEKKYNSVQAENVPKDPSDEGEAGRSGEESHETDRNGESNHANSVA